MRTSFYDVRMMPTANLFSPLILAVAEEAGRVPVRIEGDWRIPNLYKKTVFSDLDSAFGSAFSTEKRRHIAFFHIRQALPQSRLLKKDAPLFYGFSRSLFVYVIQRSHLELFYTSAKNCGGGIIIGALNTKTELSIHSIQEIKSVCNISFP